MTNEELKAIEIGDEIFFKPGALSENDNGKRFFADSRIVLWGNDTRGSLTVLVVMPEGKEMFFQQRETVNVKWIEVNVKWIERVERKAK